MRVCTGQGVSGRGGLGRGLNLCTGQGGAGRSGLGRGVNVCTGQVGAGRGGKGRGVNAYMCRCESALSPPDFQVRLPQTITEKAIN